MNFNDIEKIESVERLNHIALKVHKMFKQKMYDNINDDYLLKILEYLDSYWFDRDRSGLIWYCTKIVGGDPEKSLIPSLIMSLTSSGIGIHDDIIDKTKIKYSKQTIPERFKMETAVVIGNLLIIKGLTCVDLLYKEFDEKHFLAIIDVFKSYFSELAIGEIWEINANKKLDLDLDYYTKMLWKLSVDGEACAKLGAISGKGTEKQIDALSIYGRSLSYTKRLLDELKDILSIEKMKSRIDNESTPLALIFASKESEENHEKIGEILKKNKIMESELFLLQKYCLNKSFLGYIYGEIDVTYANAIDSLSLFPDSQAKTMLIKLLNIILEKK